METKNKNKKTVIMLAVTSTALVERVIAPVSYTHLRAHET